MFNWFSMSVESKSNDEMHDGKERGDIKALPMVLLA